MLSLIPAEWPLKVLSSFLERSFRRALHSKHEGQIVKAIASSENLAVAESTWLTLREQGAIVEEAVDGDDEDTENEKAGPEKALGLGLELDEKSALRSTHEEAEKLRGYVVDVAPGDEILGNESPNLG